MKPHYHISDGSQTYQYSTAPTTKGMGQYYASSTYQYNWIKYPETIIYQTPFAGGLIQLTHHTLTVYTKRRQYSYPLKDIQSIDLDRKKLILPILIGGITSPLAVIAMMGRVMDRIFAASIAVVGAIILYYGWAGNQQLSITSYGKTTSFIIEDMPKEVPILIKEAQTIIKKNQRLRI